MTDATKQFQTPFPTLINGCKGFLLVGLGNPGSKFFETRHNVGHMILDVFAEALSLEFSGEYSGTTKKTSVGDKFLMLAKPESFMNTSGDAILPIMKKHGFSTDCLVVIHDDMHLPIGKIKIKKGGSHAGHNGLKSIDKVLGQDYIRVRVGVGFPETVNEEEIIKHVLGNFNSEESAVIQKTIHELVDYMLDEMSRRENS